MLSADCDTGGLLIVYTNLNRIMRQEMLNFYKHNMYYFYDFWQHKTVSHLCDSKRITCV